MNKQSHIWTTIRRQKGVIRAPDLIRTTGASKPAVRTYLHALCRAGLIERTRQVPGQPTEYTLVHDVGPAAPRIDKTTREITTRPTARYRAWQAIRVLRTFSVPDVAASAETSVHVVRHLLQGLCPAGYAIKTAAGGAAVHAEYRLIRDPGPLPPRLSRHRRSVFDPNSNQIISL